MAALVGAAVLGAAAAEAATSPAPSDETARIEALIAAVRASDVTFVRNGRAHTPAEAADHLTSKWRAAGSRVRTAEDFIERVGSRSSTTGRPYEVILRDGTSREAGPWLHDLLAGIGAGGR